MTTASCPPWEKSRCLARPCRTDYCRLQKDGRALYRRRYLLAFDLPFSALVMHLLFAALHYLAPGSALGLLGGIR